MSMKTKNLSLVGILCLVVFTLSNAQIKIDSNNNIGLGTATPESDRKTTLTGHTVMYGSMGLFFDRDDAGSYYAQTDGVMCITKSGSNNAGLGFNISNNNGVSYTNILFLQGLGPVVGIGTTTPSIDFKLDVNGKIRGTEVWAGSNILTSDIRLKKDVKDLNSNLSKIKDLKPIEYKLNELAFHEIQTTVEDTLIPINLSDSLFLEKQKEREEQMKKIHYGFSAQDLQNIFPELVSENGDGYLGVNYNGIIPVLVGAMQEQEAIIEELKEKADKQQALIDELIATMTAETKK